MSSSPRTPLALALLAGALACRPGAEAKAPAAVSSPPAARPLAQVWPDEPFRSQRPSAGEMPPVTLPTPERFSTPNGLDVFLVPQKLVPTVQLTWEFEAGDVSDPRDKVGRNALCMDLLDEGTARLDKVAWEEKQADHAVSIWAAAGEETSTIGLRALRRELGSGIDLAVGLLHEPGLRPEDLDRIREHRKAAVRQRRAAPAAIASRLFPALLFGEGHPYGRFETEASLDQIELADCKQVAAQLRPRGARLFVAGMISREELERELDGRLGWWKGTAPRGRKPPRPAGGRAEIVFVDAPQANQSQVWLGHLGPSRGARDYTATEIMADVLGGGFTGRVNMNLREGKGFTYGSRAGFRYRRHGSYLAVTSQVRVDATASAIREMMTELARMRSEDPTPEEVRREVEGRLSALPARFATAARTADAFGTLLHFGLPLDWYATYQGELRTLEVAAVRQAAQAHLRTSDVTVLVVGDAATVMPELRKLADDPAFGRLRVVDADGRAVAAPASPSVPR